MKFALKNGTVAEIKPLSANDSAEELRSFLFSLIHEKPAPFILRNCVPSLIEEKKWLKETLESQRRKNSLTLIARINGKIAGSAGAKREKFRDSDKVSLGIAIAKHFRGIGLGTVLFRELIKLTKKLFKPKLIYLQCIAANKPARAMYRKFGLHEFARFKKWQKHRGKYEDMVFMKLGAR